MGRRSALERMFTDLMAGVILISGRYAIWEKTWTYGPYSKLHCTAKIWKRRRTFFILWLDFFIQKLTHSYLLLIGQEILVCNLVLTKSDSGKKDNRWPAICLSFYKSLLHGVAQWDDSIKNSLGHIPNWKSMETTSWIFYLVIHKVLKQIKVKLIL